VEQEAPHEAGVEEAIVEQPALASSHQTAEVAGVPVKKESTSGWHRLIEFNSLTRAGQVPVLPFCIADNLTLQQFHAKCDDLESDGCFRWEFKDGKAWIYEIPHAAHDRAAGEVIKELSLALGQHSRDVASAASPRCDNNAANWSYEPDGSLTHDQAFPPGPNHHARADAEGNRWPNIIVEVAFQESEPHVLDKALDWLETARDHPNLGVQQVIVIKIGTALRADSHRTMRAWRYERGATENPVQEIEFGNHGPNRGATEVGLAGMQLHIPVASIYLPNAPPADLPVSLVLDLFYIRRKIERAFASGSSRV
jgi:Uma2 family endonuclease